MLLKLSIKVYLSVSSPVSNYWDNQAMNNQAIRVCPKAPKQSMLHLCRFWKIIFVKPRADTSIQVLAMKWRDLPVLMITCVGEETTRPASLI